VNGVDTPEMLKPVPLTFTCETVKLAEPLLVRVIVWLFVLPTFVLPKFSLFGEAPSCDCVPEPLSEIVSGEFGPSFATEMLPVAEPVVVGANFAVKLTLWPAVNVVGVVKPEIIRLMLEHPQPHPGGSKPPRDPPGRPDARRPPGMRDKQHGPVTHRTIPFAPRARPARHPAKQRQRPARTRRRAEAEVSAVTDGNGVAGSPAGPTAGPDASVGV